MVIGVERLRTTGLLTDEFCGSYCTATVSEVYLGVNIWPNNESKCRKQSKLR